MTYYVTMAVAFVVALGCLIVVHELGHYVIARACGVKVLRFSVGFGKPLWARRIGRDATEWVVAAVPLGGYVKMLDEREGAVAAPDLPRAFNRQSVWRRIAIVVAGPAANFLLAIALYWALFIYGIPGLKPVIGAPPPGSAAQVTGFSAGDTLLTIDDDPVPTWQDARWLLLKRAVQKSAVKIEVRHENGNLDWLKLDLSKLTADDLDSDFLRTLGLARAPIEVVPEVGRVIAGGAADRAGLKIGDEIAAIGDREMTSIDQTVRTIRENPGKDLAFSIRRNGVTQTVRVTPEPYLEKEARKLGRIQAELRGKPEALAKYLVEVRYGPAESLVRAFYKTWDTSIFSLKMLGKMITGEISLKNLSGPITIADYAGQSAQSGVGPYLLFLALISISLGVLNLLPIPLLDGGHLLYYTIEVFKGRPLSERTIEIGQHVGMALLFTLMAFALYNDITRLLVSG